MRIKKGDYVKVKDQNRVFKVAGFTKGYRFIPDGWYLDKDEFAINPIHCEKYKGALSALMTDLVDI